MARLRPFTVDQKLQTVFYRVPLTKLQVVFG
jgi:hypothetical protein